MNQLRWYTTKIWNQSEYDKSRKLYPNKADWYTYLITNDLDNCGEYYLILKKVLSDNKKFEIEFLNFNSKPYYIDADILLTSIRSDVLEVPGIHVYMEICRLLRILNQKINGNRKPLDVKSFIHKTHDIFPDTYQIKDIKQLIQSLLYYRVISTKANEQLLWTQIVKSYFSTMVLTSADLDLVTQFENALKTIIGETGNSPCVVDCSSLLNYKNRLGNQDLRHKILADLGIKVCPYCNRNYVTWYKSQNQIITTADLDHYYQKDRYPLFALSLFNFIPSCQVCNSRLKGTKPMEITLYPFEEGFGEDATFCVKPVNDDPNDPDYAKSILNLWLGVRNANLTKHKISIDIKNNVSAVKRSKIEGSVKLFQLEEIYSAHLDKVLDIILITRCYDNPEYKEYCDKILQKLSLNYKANSLTIFEAYYDYDWMTFGYHWHIQKDSMNFDAPLSRMTWDIFKQYQKQDLFDHSNN